MNDGVGPVTAEPIAGSGNEELQAVGSDFEFGRNSRGGIGRRPGWPTLYGGHGSDGDHVRCGEHRSSLMDEENADKSRRAILLGLSAAFLLPAPALAQGLCPAGGHHLWVVWGTDNKTGRTIQICMKCGTYKIG